MDIFDNSIFAYFLDVQNNQQKKLGIFRTHIHSEYYCLKLQELHFYLQSIKLSQFVHIEYANVTFLELKDT